MLDTISKMKMNIFNFPLSIYYGIKHLCDALGTPIRVVDKNWVTVKDETFKAFGEQLTSSGSFVNTHRHHFFRLYRRCCNL